MSLSIQLDGFELKLRQLASKLERQAAEKESLKAENKQLKTELDRQLGAISSLKEKLARASNLSSATTATADQEKETSTSPTEKEKIIQTEIDFCIQEIDKCIVWLQEK